MTEITKVDETTREKLRQTVAKIERLEEEKQEVAEQIKEVYAEAKAVGLTRKRFAKLSACGRLKKRNATNKK